MDDEQRKRAAYWFKRCERAKAAVANQRPMTTEEAIAQLKMLAKARTDTAKGRER